MGKLRSGIMIPEPTFIPKNSYLGEFGDISKNSKWVEFKKIKSTKKILLLIFYSHQNIYCLFSILKFFIFILIYIIYLIYNKYE